MDRRVTRSFLIVLPSWVGDTCMATPALRHIRSHSSGARITALGRPMLAPLLNGLPFIDEFIGSSLRGVRGLRESLALRRQRFDAAILFPNSFRSAAFTLLAGVPQRVGTARDGRSWLITRRVDDRADMRTAPNTYAKIAQAWTGLPLSDLRLELAVTAADRESARVLLGESQHATTTREWIVLNPGANREDKRWPASRFADAARELAQLRGLSRDRIAVTGSPSEAPVCATIARECGALDLCAKGVALGSLKGVLERTAILLTNDTGPSHMAAALGTPAVTLFGPTDHRWTLGHTAIERRLIAEPFLTESVVADNHQNACAIERITVADVVHAAVSLLGPPTAKASA